MNGKKPSANAKAPTRTATTITPLEPPPLFDAACGWVAPRYRPGALNGPKTVGWPGTVCLPVLVHVRPSAEWSIAAGGSGTKSTMLPPGGLNAVAGAPDGW